MANGDVLSEHSTSLYLGKLSYPESAHEYHKLDTLLNRQRLDSVLFCDTRRPRT